MMNCKDCPLDKNCKRQGTSTMACCMGTWENCHQGNQRCRVQDICKVYTEASAVFIMEEHKGIAGLETICFGLWSEGCTCNMPCVHEQDCQDVGADKGAILIVKETDRNMNREWVQQPGDHLQGQWIDFTGCIKVTQEQDHDMF